MLELLVLFLNTYSTESCSIKINDEGRCFLWSGINDETNSDVYTIQGRFNLPTIEELTVISNLGIPEVVKLRNLLAQKGG